MVWYLEWDTWMIEQDQRWLYTESFCVQSHRTQAPREKAAQLINIRYTLNSPRTWKKKSGRSFHKDSSALLVEARTRSDSSWRLARA